MTEYDLDQFLRHQLFIERLATTGANRAVGDVQDIYIEIKRMLSGFDDIPNRAALDSIVGEIDAIVNTNNGWDNLTNENLNELAFYEAKWQAAFQQQATGLDVNIPAENKILGFIQSSMMNLTSGQRSDVGPWSSFIQGNKNNHADAVNNIVKRGFMRGQTIPQMTAEIKVASDGIISRDARSLARTGYIHYAAQANEAMVKENEDILDQYYYIVTFDNRTSDVCIGISKFNEKGMRFNVGDVAAPMPPLHFQCRTRRMAVPRDFVMMGTKASVGGQTGADAQEAFARRDKARRKASQLRYKGRKDNDIFKAGQIKASTTYESWLMSQPRWFIDDTLGPRRASLLIDDGLSLSSFSDMTGRPLTILQIIQREGRG